MSNLCVFPVLAGSAHSVVGMKKKNCMGHGTQVLVAVCPALFSKPATVPVKAF